jgi:hypothetical protein
MVVDALAHTNAPWLGQSFKPRCDIDPVSMNVAAINDNVPDVDAHPEPNQALVGNSRLVFSHKPLNFGRTANRINDACELHEQPIPHRFDNAAAVFLDFGIDQLAPQLLEPSKRPLFIKANQPAVASDIGG